MAKRNQRHTLSGAAARRFNDAARTWIEDPTLEPAFQCMQYRQLTLLVESNTAAITGPRVPGANWGWIQGRHPTTGALQNKLGPSGAGMRVDFINIMPLQLKAGIVEVSFNDGYDAYVAILADCV